MGSQSLITIALQICGAVLFSTSARSAASQPGQRSGGHRAGLWLGPVLWILAAVVGTPLAAPLVHAVPAALLIGIVACVVSFVLVLTETLHRLERGVHGTAHEANSPTRHSSMSTGA